MNTFKKDIQYYKFSAYGFLKNLQFFDPYLILFFREAGIQFFQIGILFSIREISTNILEIPTGMLADSFGRRKAMMAAFGAYIGSFLIFYFYPVFGMYAVAMVLFAVGEAFRSGTHKAMILDYLKRNSMEHLKVHYYGHTRSWSQRGSAVSALIAALLVFLSGSYRNVFLFTIIPYTFGFFLLKSYPDYLDYSSEEEPSREGGLAEQTRKSIRRTLSDLRGMITYKKLRCILMNSSIYDGVFKASKDYIQPLMKNLALSLPIFLTLTDQRRVALIVGILYFILYIGTSTVSQYSGTVAELFQSPRKGLNTTYLFSAAILVAVGISMGYNAFLPGVIVFTGFYIFHNLRRPMTVGYVSENIKGTVMATGLSIESQLKTLIVAVIAPAFGAVADAVGLEWAFGLLAVILLAAYPRVRIR